MSSGIFVHNWLGTRTFKIYIFGRKLELLHAMVTILYGHDHIKVVKYWTLEKWQKNKFGDNFFISNAIKVKFRENKSGSKCNTKFS